MESQKKAMTLRLDEDVWMRLRVVLLKEGKTLQGVFEDYVKRYVEAKEGKR